MKVANITGKDGEDYTVNPHTKNDMTAENINPFGLDSKPVKNSKCIIADLNNSRSKTAILGVYGIDKSKEGETRLYNNFGCEIYLKDNKDIQITNGVETITLLSTGNVNLLGTEFSPTDMVLLRQILDEYLTHTHNVAGVQTGAGAVESGVPS